jgi:RNA polymerase sigma factor (TIGR02999 family)
MAESPSPTPVPEPIREQVTLLLDAAARGESAAAAELLPLVYDQLRRLAQKQMHGEAPGQTLQPTALVHEAYVRLVGDAEITFQNRAHFFASAARAMRNILVDRARAKGRLRRGGDRERVELTDSGQGSKEETDLVDLDAALARLEAEDSRKAEVVMLRYFAGLSIEETAAALSLSPATVKNEWTVARAWLRRELDRAGAGHAS